MRFYLVLLLGLFSVPILAQSSNDYVDQIDSAIQQMLYSSEKELRTISCKVCDSLIFEFLLANPDNVSSLTTVRGLSLVQTPDSSIQILSAQCFEDDDNYRYLGFVVEEGGAVTRLTDKSGEIRRHSDIRLKPDRWYGLLYYDLLVLDPETYLLFGYDAFSKFRRRKVIDVLSKGRNGWIFGKALFNIPDRPDITRFVLEYAAESKVGLKYDSNREMILYDNLIPLEGIYAGQGTVMVPDGSYSAFTIKRGKLAWKEKAYNRTSTTPLSEN